MSTAGPNASPDRRPERGTERAEPGDQPDDQPDARGRPPGRATGTSGVQRAVRSLRERSGRRWWSTRRTPWLVLAASFVLVVIASLGGIAWMDARANIRDERLAHDVKRLVERRMDVYITLLRGGAALHAYDPALDRAGFERYVGRLVLNRFPGIQGIGYTVRIAPGTEDALLERARASGYEGYRLWPEHVQGERHAVLHLEPLDERNRAALGYDMHADPVRREAMDRARDRGEPAATGIVRLVQEIDTDVQPGILVYVPVYEGGAIPTTLEARRARLQGYVFAPFRARDLFESIFASSHAAAVSIDDGPRIDPSRRLYETPHTEDAHAPAPRYVRVAVAGRTWTLCIHPPAEAADAFGLGLAIALLGGLLTAFVFRSAWTETRARERAERERARAEAALATEARHAQFRETFLGVLGHDLRSPLAAVKMNAQLLLMPESSVAPGHRRALERIASSSDRAIRMVAQLLDVTRVRLGGGIPIEMRPLALAPLVRDVLEEVAATHRGAAFEQDVPEGLWVCADPDRLAQILANLAGNALAHGSPPFVIRAREQSGDRVTIEVMNGGEPIPEDVLGTLFDPFTRGTHQSKKREGLGLGLFISEQLAIAHRGSLSVISDAANGTRFVLSLEPAKRPPAS